MATPQQMCGPFSRDRMPLDQDNDLTKMLDREQPAARSPTSAVACSL
jgi:hypothetical protein